MKVKIILKNGKSNEYYENAVFMDKEAGWLVLSQGEVTGNRMNLKWPDCERYVYKDQQHIAFREADIERVEITV